MRMPPPDVILSGAPRGRSRRIYENNYPANSKSEIRNPKFLHGLSADPYYNAAVTWGFAYLLIFLGGFTLSLVSGFARRLLHPTELCDNVVVPSHEHLHGQRSPAADLLASFLTVFGLTCLVVHGLTSLKPSPIIAIGGVTGIFGIFFLRSWLCRVCDPSEQLGSDLKKVKVIREIPSGGYGQIEVNVNGAQLKLAARAEQTKPIPVGAVVEILDRTESVVIVQQKNS